MKPYQVKRVDPNSVIVYDDNQNELTCKLRGRFKKDFKRNKHFIRVGDYVEITREKHEYCVDKVLERKSSLSRPHSHFSEDEHVIAANVDQIILVVSFKSPDLKTGLIDRYAAVAELNELPLLVCFNKSDLVDLSEYDVYLTAYKDIGYNCIVCSVKTRQGIDLLRSKIKDKTSVFSGHSGVGKSSLINLVDPGFNLKTGTVSDLTNKGKHTTTSAELFILESGKIIDTPGIREFGLWGFEKDSLNLYFRDFKNFLDDCKFYNCTHIHEPKCAVKKAVEEGKINDFRYKNYLSMIDELNLNKNY